MQATNQQSANWPAHRPVTVLPPVASAFARAADHASRKVKSCDLLNGQKAVDIEHNGTVYRLHTTKLGKLILTK